MIVINIWVLVALSWVYGANARRMQGMHGTRVMGYMLYALLAAPMALVFEPWPVGLVLAALTCLQFVWPGRDFAVWWSLTLAHGVSMVAVAGLLYFFGHGPWWWVPLLMITWAPLCYLPPQAPIRERLLGAGGLGIPWVAVALSAG